MTPGDLVLTPRGLRFCGRYFPCAIGRGGLTREKTEGDGATPMGVHRIVASLYRPDRITAPNSWAVPILRSDLWCDDPESDDYNHLVQAPFTASHEAMWRADPLYDLVLLTDWNWPKAAPYCGSAIFIHHRRKPGHPTEGCLALSAPDLRWIAERVSPGTRVFV